MIAIVATMKRQASKGYFIRLFEWERPWWLREYASGNKQRNLQATISLQSSVSYFSFVELSATFWSCLDSSGVHSIALGRCTQRRIHLCGKPSPLTGFRVPRQKTRRPVFTTRMNRKKPQWSCFLPGRRRSAATDHTVCPTHLTSQNHLPTHKDIFLYSCRNSVNLTDFQNGTTAENTIPKVKWGMRNRNTVRHCQCLI